MSNDRPGFVFNDAGWQLETRHFNGIQIPLYRTEGDVSQIEGWVENPRIEMILNRWRNARHMSVAAFPDDEEMLDLMLDYDDGSFAIPELGEDVKRNGVREPIIVTWAGKLIDGNRRKFAAMWALSDRGAATTEQLHLLGRIPIFVLPQGAPTLHEDSIIIQENYAESLKKEWPQVVTNGRLYRRFHELSNQFPNEQELAIRRRVRSEFPRFGISEIRNRINTWLLIEEFRADYSDEENEDDLEAKINKTFQYFRQANDTYRTKNISEIRNRINTWLLIEEFRADYSDEENEDDLEAKINKTFQYFRQANDTYRTKNVFVEPEFKQLLFRGIQQELFPSFASVRRLEEIYQNPQATELFLGGEGLSGTGLRANFDRAVSEARREEATRNLTVERRLESIIESIDHLTSVELATIPANLRSRLESALQRIIAQATVSTDEANDLVQSNEG